MINEIKNHSFSTPYLNNRTLGIGVRENNEYVIEPVSIHLQAATRFIAEGVRSKETKALLLASYIPLLLTAEAAASGDSGGAIVLIICCVITVYIFGVTGWSNEKIK